MVIGAFEYDADVLLSAAVATGASRAVGLELDTEFPYENCTASRALGATNLARRLGPPEGISPVDRLLACQRVEASRLPNSRCSRRHSCNSRCSPRRRRTFSKEEQVAL